MAVDVREKQFDENIEKLLEGKRYTQLEIQSKILEIKEKYPNVTIKRVCSYGRVSTTHDEQESSLFTQNTVFHTYCERKEQEGWVLVEEVYDRKSATILSKRKKFLYIIEKAKRGEFDILLFKDSKRFSRNTSDFLDLIEELKRLGVYVVFINEMVSSETASREQLTMLGMMSESHSNGLHVSVTNAMLVNMKRPEGRMTHSTFGYDKPTVRDSRIAYINEKEAELIRELFTRLRNLEGFASICEDWRARGIKTKKGYTMDLHNLRRYARNKKYIGIIEMNKDKRADVRSERVKTDPSEWIIAYREDLRIIDDDLFYEVQKIIDSRKHLTAKACEASKTPIVRNRMMSGVMICSCCGRKFKRMQGGGKRTYNYFGCDTVKQKKKHTSNTECTNTRNIRQDEFYQCMSLYFKELLENQDNLKELVRERITSILDKQAKESVDYISEDEIVKAKEKMERAKDLFIEGMISRAEFDKYKDELKELENKSSNNKLGYFSSIDIDAVVEKFCENLEKCIQIGLSEDSMDGVQFNSLFDSIIAYPDNLEVNFKLYDSPLLDTDRCGCTAKNDRTININHLINWHFVGESCLRIKTLDHYNRRMYRLSKIYGHIGIDYEDKINIVI